MCQVVQYGADLTEQKCYSRGDKIYDRLMRQQLRRVTKMDKTMILTTLKK